MKPHEPQRELGRWRGPYGGARLELARGGGGGWGGGEVAGGAGGGGGRGPPPRAHPGLRRPALAVPSSILIPRLLEHAKSARGHHSSWHRNGRSRHHGKLRGAGGPLGRRLAVLEPGCASVRTPTSVHTTRRCGSEPGIPVCRGLGGSLAPHVHPWSLTPERSWARGPKPRGRRLGRRFTAQTCSRKPWLGAGPLRERQPQL